MRSPIILRIFKGTQLVGVKQFDSDQIVVGHNADVQLDLDSDGVSPIHCLIEKRDEKYFVSDLGSTSGTFKNSLPVLDEELESGDELTIGPFTISFFVGVPKPKAPGVTPVASKTSIAEKPTPVAAVAPQVETSQVAPTPAAVPEASVVEAKPVPQVKTEVVPRPVIKNLTKETTSLRKKPRSGTFAPPSEYKDLREFLRPSRGASVQIILSWKERAIDTVTLDKNGVFKSSDIFERNYFGSNEVAPSFELANGTVRVNLSGNAEVSYCLNGTWLSADEAVAKGKQKGSAVIEQGEMLSVKWSQSYYEVHVRFVQKSMPLPMIPVLNFSGSEMTGVIASVVLVGLLALFISATTPNELLEQKPEEVQRKAQIIFDKPPVVKPPVAIKPPEPVVTATPTPTPTQVKKVIVDDKKRDAQVKGNENLKTQKAAQAVRANEVAPKNTTDKQKKFTSTRQGGAIKTGNTAGANAQSANKDVTKVGLFSAFGGGGSRAKIDQGYSGAGEILGMADKATGTSGFNENREGGDLGSKFKDSGAGGKGTATQGIAGIGTKGRGSGQSAYGASEGIGGGKSSVAIAGGGFEEAFDGTIDKEAIRRVIRAKLNEVKSCYERALNTLEKGRKLEGKVVLSWEIIDRGQARNVKVKSSTLGNPQVENCIRDRLASWTFPEPPSGLVAEVSAYPFVLNQGN